MKKAKTILITVVFCSAIILLYAFTGCPIRFLFGISCPGCGMTHALFSLLRLDFSGAAYCHPLVFALIPAAAAALIFRKNTKALYGILFAFCAALAAVYVFRLIRGSCPDFVFIHPEKGEIYRVIRSILLCQSQE